VNGATFEIGDDSGHGTLTVTNGAKIASDVLQVGSEGGTGVLTLGASGTTEPGTTSNALTQIYLGGNINGSEGSGTINVYSGATLACGGNMEVFNSASSTLNLLGGLVQVQTLTTYSGAANVTWNSTAGGTLDITQGGLTIGSTGPIGGSLTVGTGMTLDVAGELFNSGSITLNGGTIEAGTLGGTSINIVSGTLSTSTLSTPLTLSAGDSLVSPSGTLTVASTGVLTINTGVTVSQSLASSGTVNVSGSVTFTGSVSFATGSTFDATGATVEFSNPLQVSGLYDSDPSTNLFDGLTVTSSGTVEIATGDTFSLTNGSTLVNAGNITSGGSLTTAALTDSGTFSQTGGTTSVTGAVTLQSGGKYALSGGTLDAATISIPSGAAFSWTGGTLSASTITQTGGTFSAVGPLTIAGTGGTAASYILSAGALSAGATTVSSGGTYSQSGGTATFTSFDYSNASSFAFTGGSVVVNGGEWNPQMVSSDYNEGNIDEGLNPTWLISGLSAPTLTLQGGASTNASDAFAMIGHNGQSGIVNVIGTGTTFSLGSQVFVGIGGANSGSSYTPGSGSINFSPGTQGNIPYISAGVDGGTGLITVNNATLATNGIFIGDGCYITAATGTVAATGTLSISNSASVTSQNAYIGYSGASGVVTLGTSQGTAPLTSWTNTGTIYLGSDNSGDFGTGTLNVQSRAILTTAGLIAFNGAGTAGGSINLSGGTINTGSLTLGMPSDLNWSSGVLNITASVLTIGPGGPLGSTSEFTLTSGHTLQASQGVSVSGVLSLSGGVLAAPISISSTGEVIIPTANGPQTLQSLTITAGGILDLTNNHILIDYGASDPIATIQGYLASGFNNGAWNGPGIISSAAQTLTNGLRYGVGWADGADHVVVGLSSGQIELKYTLLGDANLDGTVNGSDFSILAANFGTGATNWDQGNFLYGSSVNGSDFSALAANFGQGDSGADVQVTQADIEALDSFAIANGLPLPTFAAVPEPASCVLLSLATISLLARRRRA